ncbi:hypothetical protein VQH23_16345 [Pararoseomonas sp. SCSIO 73927]|uniref:hypothetical protein n=1 Tax=Pararoseomonas sp. SCSIO 73927 TaxID=3114537 RepID=UPI0030D04F59
MADIPAGFARIMRLSSTVVEETGVRVVAVEFQSAESYSIVLVTSERAYELRLYSALKAGALVRLPIR